MLVVCLVIACAYLLVAILSLVTCCRVVFSGDRKVIIVTLLQQNILHTYIPLSQCMCYIHGLFRSPVFQLHDHGNHGNQGNHGNHGSHCKHSNQATTSNQMIYTQPPTNGYTVQIQQNPVQQPVQYY